MTCKCYLPPYTTDSPEICEAVGGQCVGLNEIWPQFPSNGVSCPSEGQEYPRRSSPSPSSSAGVVRDCRTPIQRVMQVPFELCPEHDELLDDIYVWEDDDDV